MVLALSITYKAQERTFSNDSIEKYHNNSDFNYIEKPTNLSWWQLFKEWLYNILKDFFSDKSGDEIVSLLDLILDILMWGIITIAVGIVAYSLYKRGFFGITSKKSTKIDHSFVELEEQVLETNWKKLIDEAISKEQFNSAIRFMFLRILQSLNQEGKIIWQKSKSIRDYQREVPRDIKSEFKDLATYYQYSWFGKVSIDHIHFENIKKEFEQFNSLLNVE